MLYPTHTHQQLQTHHAHAEADGRQGGPHERAAGARRSLRGRTEGGVRMHLLLGDGSGLLLRLVRLLLEVQAGRRSRRQCR